MVYYGRLEWFNDAIGLKTYALQVKTANVLPILLEKRDQKVDRHHGVGQELIFVHVDVTDGNSKAENLLQLELNIGIKKLFLVRQSARLTLMVLLTSVTLLERSSW